MAEDRLPRIAPLPASWLLLNSSLIFVALAIPVYSAYRQLNFRGLVFLQFRRKLPIAIFLDSD